MAGLTPFLFEQTVPSKRWTINHNLGHHPVTDVFANFEDGLQKMMPLTLEHMSANQTVVTFTEPRTGKVSLY